MLTDGTIIDDLPSPIADLKGIAWDTRSNDGFWLLPANGPSVFTKVDLTGGVVTSFTQSVSVLTNRQCLDFTPQPDAASDLIGVIGININAISVLQGITLTGTRLLEAGHYDGGFRSGHVGVQLEDSTDVWAGYAEWLVTVPPTGLEHWTLATHVYGSVANSVAGIDRAPDGTLWIVSPDDGLILHYDADGVTFLGSIVAPDDAFDLTVVPAP
jgi:hypothetical protein